MGGGRGAFDFNVFWEMGLFLVCLSDDCLCFTEFLSIYLYLYVSYFSARLSVCVSNVWVCYFYCIF